MIFITHCMSGPGLVGHAELVFTEGLFQITLALNALISVPLGDSHLPTTAFPPDGIHVAVPTTRQTAGLAIEAHASVVDAVPHPDTNPPFGENVSVTRVQLHGDNGGTICACNSTLCVRRAPAKAMIALITRI